jgi:hypothetical protein
MPIMNIADAYPIAEKQVEAIDQMRIMNNNPDLYRPLTTSIPRFFLPNPNVPTLNYIGGEYKTYKSTMLAEMMYTYAKAQFRTLWAIKEENMIGVAKRTLSRGTRLIGQDGDNRVSRNRMRDITLSKDDFALMDNTAQEATNFPLFITDETDKINVLSDMARQANCQVIGVDYYTLFELDGSKAKTPREMYVEMSRHMVAMKRNGITWVVAYQVNDQGKAKETRVVYDDADNAWQLSRCKDAATDEIDPHKLVMTAVATRDGMVGTWELFVDGEYNLIHGGLPKPAVKGSFII